jgi:hypothetical protein
VNEVIREEIKKFLESSENTTYQNLWNIAKVMLRGNFIKPSVPMFKSRDLQINNLVMYLKLLEKQEQTKPQTSRRTEIIKIRAEINGIKTNKLYKESMKQNFFL